MSKIKTHRLRFYGMQSSLSKWRDIVIATDGTVSPVAWTVERPPRAYFESTMTAEQRAILGQKWTEESGTGYMASGHPYLWNDCIGFAEI